MYDTVGLNGEFGFKYVKRIIFKEQVLSQLQPQKRFWEVLLCLHDLYVFF